MNISLSSDFSSDLRKVKKRNSMKEKFTFKVKQNRQVL